MIAIASLLGVAVVIGIADDWVSGALVGSLLLLGLYAADRYMSYLRVLERRLDGRMERLETATARTGHEISTLTRDLSAEVEALAKVQLGERDVDRLHRLEVSQLLTGLSGRVEELSSMPADLAALRDLIVRFDHNEQARERQAQRQLEGLHGLYATLEPDLPLPPLGGWALSADVLAFLVDHVLSSRPNFILELGSGTSTSVLGLALRLNSEGQLLSLEHDPGYLETTRSAISRRGLDDIVHLVLAPLVEIPIDEEITLWYDLSEVVFPDQIDLVIVDGPPWTEQSSRYPALPILSDYIRPGGVLIMDDAKREGEASIIARWSERHPEFSVRVVTDHEKGTAVFTKRDS
jgi:predicted O-methyltransferase YrrM